MKIIRKITLLISALSHKVFASDEFNIQPPSEIIDHNNLVSHGMNTAQFVIKSGAGLFSLVCFIQAASFARQGRYANCVGSLVGGVISAAAVFLTGKFSQ